MTTTGPSSADHLATPLAPPAAPAERSRLLALLIAAVIPGAGHIYLRRPLAGLLWMAAALGVYATSLVGGLVLHGLCLVSTAFIRQR
jgi:hypothetical protein